MKGQSVGIPIQVLKLLEKENQHKPITGTFASIGVQTVHASVEEIVELAPRFAGKKTASLVSESATRHASGTITDRDLISGLFDVNYSTIDRSSYEGASIILDLNKPVPVEFHNRFDFVYSGGSLDNLFDPATMLVNCANLLKPGGRFLSYDAAQGLIGAYLQITPEWLYSWFAANRWADCQIRVLHQESQGPSRFKYETSLYNWSPNFMRNPDFNYYAASLTHCGIQYVTCIAEKGSASTSNVLPTQLQYIDEDSVDWTQMENSYELSKRRLKPSASGPSRGPIFGSTHYMFIESGF